MTSVATAAAASLEALVADYPRHLPVLVVDDEEDVRSVIGRCLEKFDVNVVESATLRHARDRFKSGEQFSFVFLDRCLPDGDGVDFAREILEWSPNLAVAIITAMGSGPNAEKALKEGAFAYLPKPCSISDIRKALFKRYPRLSDSFSDGELAGPIIDGSPLGDEESGVTLIAHSPQMIKLRLEILEIAKMTRSVLVSGASGTGKELIARKIHERSTRADRGFVGINCGAMNIDLIESTLFGHVKGAFTGAVNDRKGLFEVADGGTVFLDEITETSAAFQVKLLRVLQEQRFSRVGSNHEIVVDVRVIAASNRNVLEEVVSGRFREDLYYRLKGSEIFLPALKERPEDIEPLANYFANVTVKETKKRVGFSRAAMTALQTYDWPGNVRELQFAVDSAVQRCNGIVLISDLPNEVAQGDLRADELPVVGNPSLRCLEDASNDHILRVLRLCRGNKSKAADILKINRTTIMRLSKKKGWEDRFASEWAISD